MKNVITMESFYYYCQLLQRWKMQKARRIRRQLQALCNCSSMMMAHPHLCFLICNCVLQNFVEGLIVCHFYFQYHPQRCKLISNWRFQQSCDQCYQPFIWHWHQQNEAMHFWNFEVMSTKLFEKFLEIQYLMGPKNMMVF